MGGLQYIQSVFIVPERFFGGDAKSGNGGWSGEDGVPGQVRMEYLVR